MPMTLTDTTRSALWVLVDREERRTGSRGGALEIVAQTVGMSSSWIAKFLSKSTEAKEPRITLFLNIREAYERVCSRVEQEHANELLKIEKLRGELNAVTAGFEELVDGQTRAKAVGKTS